MKKARQCPVEELQKEFGRWDELYANGGHDPFWPDGSNLNLVRNHILYFKKEIEAAYEHQNYPTIYYRETPPEVSQDYMARSDEIRVNARKSVQLYKADENYQFLYSQVNRIHPKHIKETCIKNVIHYVKGLEQAISSDDLVSMRRHENPERYIEAFLECAEKVKSLKPIENEQISFFTMFPDELDEESEECEEEDQGMSMSM